MATVVVLAPWPARQPLSQLLAFSRTKVIKAAVSITGIFGMALNKIGRFVSRKYIMPSLIFEGEKGDEFLT
jgi:hypothetical protein